MDGRRKKGREKEREREIERERERKKICFPKCVKETRHCYT